MQVPHLQPEKKELRRKSPFDSELSEFKPMVY